jgi:Putative zinc-finger
MNCQDFRELSDSYLSNELLVETNHEVIHHLENCAACRQVLSFRRELRGKLRQTLKNSAEFQPNFAFETRLRANLKDEVSAEKSWFNLRFLATAMAGLLIVFSIGFGVSYFNKQSENSSLAKLAWQEINKDAIGDHKFCAIDKLKQFELAGKEISTEKTEFKEKHMKSLQANFSPNVQVLVTHKCEFNGRVFNHTILQEGNHTVSVLLTESDSALDAKTISDDAIATNSEAGFQIASFKNDKKAIFVISNLPETKNLGIARTISKSI